MERTKRTWQAGKPKKKPDYNREEITEELLAAVVGGYENLDEYYPDKVYRNLYEMRLYNAFAL